VSRSIMAHMVAFYPGRGASLETARALADGGARYLEVQFPFSDPTADGPLIQEACRRALERGFKVRLGFDLVREIRESCGIPVFVMGYANTVFFHGVGGFVETAAESGACGVIVPDLPPDYDEGLFQAAGRAGVQAVPVVSPSTSDGRLNMVLAGGSEFVYTTLRSGITGAYTAIGEGNIAFLERVAGHGKKTLAGFGISEKKQVDALSPHVHACVVGSAFVRVVAETGSDEGGRIYRAVRRKMESLAG
jgi:tryptophan synthase alpha chain